MTKLIESLQVVLAVAVSVTSIAVAAAAAVTGAPALLAATTFCVLLSAICWSLCD